MASLRCVVLLAALTAPASAAQSPVARLGADDLLAGRRLFEAQCARCHGMLGEGGEGADLTRPILRYAADDAALHDVIRNGIARAGMPGAWLSEQETWQIAGYVRSLARPGGESAEGDPEGGRRLFETTGNCATCHVVRGKGTALGPELTDVGARRGAGYLREALVNPAATLPHGVSPALGGRFVGYLPVRAVTADGREIAGARVNEDAFTIQIREAGGRVHSLRKADLRTLTKSFDRSLMPGVGSALSAGEIDDLVAYLLTLRGTP